MVKALEGHDLLVDADGVVVHDGLSLAVEIVHDVGSVSEIDAVYSFILDWRPRGRNWLSLNLDVVAGGALGLIGLGVEGVHELLRRLLL